MTQTSFFCDQTVGFSQVKQINMNLNYIIVSIWYARAYHLVNCHLVKANLDFKTILFISVSS